MAAFNVLENQSPQLGFSLQRKITYFNYYANVLKSKVLNNEAFAFS